MVFEKEKVEINIGKKVSIFFGLVVVYMCVCYYFLIFLCLSILKVGIFKEKIKVKILYDVIV